MKYILQLDAMRGIAIIFVLCNHALPKGHLLVRLTDKVSGPDVFFTISGFLITALLLKDRIASDQQGITKPEIFKNFFVKRALRIYPAYYLIVALDFMLKGAPSTSYSSYLIFTSNFVIYQQQDWGRLSHLWSMAVEQQFYLLWPFIIVLLPRKWVPYAIVLFIGVGLYSQRVLPKNGFTPVLPQTCFDALGLGALLAWLIIEKARYFDKVYRGLCVLALVGLGLMVGDIAFGINPHLNQRTLIACVVVWLIGYFVSLGDKEGGVLNAVFTSKPLIFIGKISYGIYLYHLTVLYFSYPVLHRLNSHFPFYAGSAYGYWLVLAENILIIFVLAWGSWIYFESPANAMSKYWVSKKITQPKAVAIE